jgi:hypothetical protein
MRDAEADSLSLPLILEQIAKLDTKPVELRERAGQATLAGLSLQSSADFEHHRHGSFRGVGD